MVDATQGPSSAQRADLVAGIALAAFAIPESMAYATLAGMPPQAGLYGYLAAGPLFALFTSSRHVAVGPTSAISLMVAAALAPLAGGDQVRYGQLAAATALMVAAMALVAWLLRLNQLVNFISEPILIGFKAGVALVIASKQLPHLLGVEMHASGFFRSLAYLARHLGEAHLVTAALGVGALALILLLERKLPGGVVVLGVVVASIAASFWLGLPARGVKVAHEVPAGLPWPALPRFSAGDADELVPLAFACFVMGFIETTAVARTFAMKHRYPVDPRREMLALTAANVGTGLLHGYPVSGGMSQSAVNEQGGARSARSLAFAAAAIALVLLFLTGPFRYLPEATLAALVLAAVSGLVERAPFRHLREVSPMEFRAAFIALLGVVLLGILRGVMLAVVVTLLMMIRRMSKPAASLRGRRPGTDEFVDLERHPEARPVTGALVYRVDEPLVYFNVDHVRDDLLERVRAASARPRLVVLELSLSPRLDSAAINMLGELEEQLRLLGAALRLAEVHSEALARLRDEGIVNRFGGVERRAPVVTLVAEDTAGMGMGHEHA
jgi:high affinity sulfate transporter 1